MHIGPLGEYMTLLYRGVSTEIHHRQGGRLIPTGSNVDIVMRRNDADRGAELRRDGTFQRVPSEVNTARGHQLVTGIHDGCFISTTEESLIAIRFATNNGTTDGYVYVFDQRLFSPLGVVSIRFPDPRYPDEQEVSIRAADGGEIPQQIIVEVWPVSAGEYVA